MHRKIALFTTLIALVLSSVFPFFSTPRENGRITVDLYLDWESVSSPNISPDGTQMIYSRRWVDKVHDRFAGEIWIMNMDGSKKRFLLKGSSPRWSPDGKRLAYLAKGEPSGTQIFVRWLGTGQSTQITRLDESPADKGTA